MERAARCQIVEEPVFYDRDGKVIDLATHLRLHADASYRFLRRDRVGDHEVVTAWLGLDQSLGDGDAPLIFGSAVLVPGGAEVVNGLELLAATETEALRNHAALVRRARG